MGGIDRLNQLTDDMLVDNIISRLDCTTKELIRTTATISKRWKNLWTQLPRLSFVDREDTTYFVGVAGPDLHDYMNFIDNTLSQCSTNLKLKKFKLDMNFSSRVNSDFIDRATSWIRYAISRKVEDIDLRLWDGIWDGEFCYTDEVFFNNLCFNRVKLTLFMLEPPEDVISWGRLRSLTLYDCESLDEDMIETILVGSPCLEFLELSVCYGYERIDITSKSVKRLVFSGYNSHGEVNVDDDYIDSVTINAPYISSLSIEDNLVLRELVLLDVSSLVEAELYYWINRREYKRFEEEVFRGLSKSLSRVKENIAYGDRCLELLSRLEAGKRVENGDREEQIAQSDN